jgi:hypothetical protein
MWSSFSFFSSGMAVAGTMAVAGAMLEEELAMAAAAGV